MSIVHHPIDETLVASVQGTLDEGRRVVVAAHIEMCESCQRFTRALEHAAGVHLEEASSAALAPDALARLLVRLDEPARAPMPPRPIARHDLPVVLRALAPYDLGAWRWIGWGVQWRSAAVPMASGARVFLLKSAPGSRLPRHTHTGTELTLILKGAFAHAGGRFGAGDFDEADGTIEHQPVVEPGEECICLVAMEGQLRLTGWMGQLLQPFVRV